MANNWVGSDFVLVANVDEGEKIKDSSPVGTNTLTDTNNVIQSVDAMQGDRSVSFTSGKHLSIPDASTSPTFPVKNGTSNRIFTTCFFMKLPADWATGYIFSKYSVTKRSIIGWMRSAGNFALIIGTGASQYLSTYTNILDINKWYHFTCTYTYLTNAWTIRIWDMSTETLFANLSGVSTYTMGVSDGAFHINGDTSGANTGTYLIDEFALAPSVYSANDTDLIMRGLFGDQASPYKISGYLQDPSAKLLVLKETDWSVEKTQDVTLGNYEILDIEDGKKTIVAVSPDGEVVGFGGVDPIEV